MSTDLIRYAPGEALSAAELVSRWSVVTSEPDQRSIFSRLCGECIDLFKQIAVSERFKDRVAPYAVRQMDRSRCRLILWADAYQVTEGGLDEAADESRYLRRKVLRILCNIAETLIERFLPKLRLQESFITEKLESCRQEALTSIQQDYRDRETHDSASESDGSDSDLSVSSEIEDSVESLETDTQLLMDLDRFIQAASSLIESDRKIAKEAPLKEWQPEDSFAQIIRTRFPEAIEQLVNVLAKANLSRMQKCIESGQAEPEQEAVVITARAVPTSTVGDKTRNDSGYGTMPNNSMRAESREAQSRYAETVMSYAAGDRTVKIPPLPAGAKEGKPFDCVACSKKVYFTRSKMWKRHLFSDLQPWTCVEPDCSAVSATFQTRETWAQHLEFDHEYGPAWLSRSCALCKEPTGDGFEACTKHLSNHLEEISLAALPRPVDEEDVSQVSISSNSSEAVTSWACDQCDQVFDQPHRLKHHLRYHAKEHKCPYDGCGKNFGTETHLRRHVQDRHEMHERKKMYHCAVQGCQYFMGTGKGFLRKDSWRRHMTEIHGMDAAEYSDGELTVERSSAWPTASNDAYGWTSPLHNRGLEDPRDYYASCRQTCAMLLSDRSPDFAHLEDARMGDLVTVLDMNGDMWQCQSRGGGIAYLPSSQLAVIYNPIKSFGWQVTSQGSVPTADQDGFPEVGARSSSISFLDAIGRGFILPLKLCSTMTEMDHLVQRAFADVAELKLRIEKRHYRFVEQSLGVLNPWTWAAAAQPGSKIRMVLEPLHTMIQATKDQQTGGEGSLELRADGDTPVQTTDSRDQTETHDSRLEKDHHVPSSASHLPARASGSNAAEVLNRPVDESMQSRHETRDWNDQEWTSIEDRLLGESRALWRKIKAHPDTYIMSTDEYLVFNTFRDSLKHDKLASELEAKAAKRYLESIAVPTFDKLGSPLPVPSQTEAEAEAEADAEDEKLPNSTTKQHKCPYCKKTFTRHHNLKSHLLTHSQEKPFACVTCDMQFRRLNDLERHNKLHAVAPSHPCPHCAMEFKTEDALVEHRESNCESSQSAKSPADELPSQAAVRNGINSEYAPIFYDNPIFHDVIPPISISDLGHEAERSHVSNRSCDAMRVPPTPNALFMSADPDASDDTEVPPPLPPPHFPLSGTADGHEKPIDQSRDAPEGTAHNGQLPDSRTREFGFYFNENSKAPGPSTLLKTAQLATRNERNSAVPSSHRQTLKEPMGLPHNCPECNSRFENADSLSQHHIQAHWSQGDHKCSFCGSSFRDQQILQLHLDNICPQRYEYGDADFMQRLFGRFGRAEGENTKTMDDEITDDDITGNEPRRLTEMHNQSARVDQREDGLSPALLAERHAKDRKRILGEGQRLTDPAKKSSPPKLSKGKAKEDTNATAQESGRPDAAVFSWNLDEASQVTSGFMRDFRCCGKPLPDLHALLRHYEETHANDDGKSLRTNETWKGEGSRQEFQLTQQQLEFVRASPYLSMGLTSLQDQTDAGSPGLYNNFSTPYHEEIDPSGETAKPRPQPEVPKTISPEDARLDSNAEDEYPLLEIAPNYPVFEEMPSNPIFDETPYMLPDQAQPSQPGVSLTQDRRFPKLDRTMTDVYSDELYDPHFGTWSERTPSTKKMRNITASSVPDQPRILDEGPKLDRTMADVFSDQLYNPEFEIAPEARQETVQGQKTAGSSVFQQRLEAANQHHERDSQAASLRDRSPFRTASPFNPGHTHQAATTASPFDNSSPFRTKSPSQPSYVHEAVTKAALSKEGPASRQVPPPQYEHVTLHQQPGLKQPETPKTECAVDGCTWMASPELNTSFCPNHACEV